MRCRILRLMLWRSYKKQKEHKINYLLAAVIPLIFSIIILILRSMADIGDYGGLGVTMKSIEYEFWWHKLIDKINNRRQRMTTERPNFQSNVFIPTLTLGYAPNSTAGIRKLIEGVSRSMSMTPAQISSFADCEELRIRAYAEQFIASICFHNVDESQRGLPLNLHFSILLPAELRNYDDSWIGNSWTVNTLYRTIPGHQINLDDNSSVSNYVREGFISLQYYISVQYLQIASGSAKIPEVILLSYTLNHNTYDLLSMGVNTPIIVLLLGFMLPVTIFTKDIVEERAVGVNFALNTDQQVSRLQFVVWYLNGICLLMVTCMVFTLMLKINWGGHASPFNKCPWPVMLLFFISYVLSAVAFAILMGVMMGSSKMVVAVVPVYWILASLTILAGQSIESTWGYFFLIAASLLLCNVTMGRGLRRILCLEHANNFNMRRYFTSTLMTGDSTLFMFICLFYIQACFYVLLAMIINGTICPCLLKLFKLTPCKLIYRKLRIWYKRRKRRKQKLKDLEAELKDNLIRHESEIIEMDEKLTKRVYLNEDENVESSTSDIEISTDNADNDDDDEEEEEDDEEEEDEEDDTLTTSESVTKSARETPIRNVSISSTTNSSVESTNARSRLMSENMPEKELHIWLSSAEVAPSNTKSEKSTVYYLQQSKSIDKQPDISKNERAAFEDPNMDETRPVVIELKNVWKKYYKTFAVRNISLKVYQNETVVLLGHNGSGKTTILDMICGIVLPTHGSITISGYDNVKQSSLAYRHVGLSLHTVYLFSEFTFSEHLIYLCRLRGLTLTQTQNDVTSYMKSMKVQHLKNTSVTRLTTGQKRLLQMLCAFAGRTKIVLLDKPMQGVDAFKRGLFYRFALQERRTRTIFITTNFPYVASNLGDRIGILINGKLQAFGSERSLVTLHRNVYRLICYLEAQCDFSKLFKYFAFHIPSIEIELRRGDSAVFVVEQFDFSRLTQLINSLGENKKDLHVESYQLITPNVEHVLLKAMMHKLKNRYGSYTLFNLATRIRHVEEMQRLVRRRLSLKSIGLFLNHVNLVFRKRFLLDIRSYSMPIMQIFLPAILCALLLCLPHLELDRHVLSPPIYQLSYFKNTMTLIQQRSSLDPLLAASQHYHNLSTVGQTIVNVNKDDDIFKAMRLIMAKKYLITDLNFVLAAIFNDDHVEALYNNNHFHSAPISLTLAMDALAVGFVNSSSGISVKLELLPFSTLHTAHLSYGVNCLDWIFKVMTCFCFSFVWALPLLNFGVGRNTPYGRVELIAGMRFSTLSIANFIYGMLKLLLSLIPLNAVMLMFNNALLMDEYENYMFFYLVLISGLYVLSLDIFVSYWISEMRLGYVLIILFYSMGILVYLALFEMPNKNLFDLNAIFSIHPYFSLLNNLLYASNLSEISEICSDKQSFETSVYLEECHKVPNCCVRISHDYLAWDLLWITYLGILFIWIVFYILNYVKIMSFKIQKKIGKEIRDSNPDSCFDQSVLHFSSRNIRDKTWINEKIRVRTLERPAIRDKALNVENLGVFFGTKVVLHRINFMLERHQILSIIGVAGSGKTVLIKSLLGTVQNNTGTIHSYCNPFFRRVGESNCMHLAYCPQDNDIVDALTVTEFIQFVLVVRGLNKYSIFNETNNLLQMFDLYDSRFHLLPHCSRGVLKRLNIAISLIGYAGLILMDDPFSYLDASSWRKIYSIIESQCNKGQAVLYTCSDPRYSDLANRTAILQSASLCVIGERQELQLEQFAAYFVVDTHMTINEIKPNLSDSNRKLFSDENFMDLQACSIIEHIFPHAIIKSRTSHMVSFWLSSTTYTMEKILQTLQENSNTFFAYSIQTPSIKQLYGSMVDDQDRIVDVTEDEDSECLHFHD